MPNFDIYVINLDKDKERLNKITEKLKPNEFTRIEAVYGATADIMNNNDIHIFGKCFTPKSVLGACLSHKIATKQFYETSDKEYGLILEDDAVPVNKNYIEEIEKLIKNTLPDWDIIKLAYYPYNASKNAFTMDFSSYIINKKSAEKILKYKVITYIDILINFYGLKIYNAPSRIFEQPIEIETSNKSKTFFLNPFKYIDTSLDYKCLRIDNYEFTIADTLLYLLIIFIIIIIIIFILFKKYFKYNLNKDLKISILNPI
jgi:GR25 family glycosyltransferase involved in LPS biosynthesis